MDCYFCQRQAAVMPAVAICQACGAACCPAHLEERSYPGRGPGLQPMLAPRIEIVCQRCLALQASLFAPARRSRGKRAKAATAPALVLPNAQEAISAVEDLLGLQRAQAASSERAGGWLRFLNRRRSGG